MTTELDTVTPFRGNSLVGMRFNRLEVVAYAGKQVTRTAWHYYWKCRCDCGTEKVISAANLKSKTGSAVKSCGCLNTEVTTKRNTTHGLAVSGSEHPLFGIWCGMKQRCYNKNSPAYKNYGGRGICISEEWVDDFKQFYNDMFPSWIRGLTIEREDNNGPYSKSNCRWVTYKEQANNTRHNKVIEFRGESLTVSEAADLYGIPYTMLSQRLRNLNWSVERALTTPPYTTERQPVAK